ncbi:MAG: hypothetical protein MJ077_08050 [Oscillospiraceae bacterium]|nr:hypothetical protein [Oscillospiraceae bacterium]
MSIHPNSNEANNPFAILSTINQVEGFDPSAFAVEYSDLTTGDTRKRLPVMAQMAWFRLKYPEGRISVEVKPAQSCFVATAKVYPHYNDPPEHFLAEATASRSYDPQNPSVSPREWAQTAAVGVALRNAGFGLQFSIAGESFSSTAPTELPDAQTPVSPAPAPAAYPPASELAPVASAPVPAPAPAPVVETKEAKLNKAMNMPCPITKYKGKTLGEVAVLDPNALNWIVRKYTSDPDIQAAAQLICEHAVEVAGS